MDTPSAAEVGSPVARDTPAARLALACLAQQVFESPPVTEARTVAEAALAVPSPADASITTNAPTPASAATNS